MDHNQETLRALEKWKALEGQMMKAERGILSALKKWTRTSSQAGLAELLGVSRAYVNDLLAERREISGKFVNRAIKALRKQNGQRESGGTGQGLGQV